MECSVPEQLHDKGMIANQYSPESSGIYMQFLGAYRGWVVERGAML